MRRGYRHCAECGRNRAERFFKAQGRKCADCRRKRRRNTSHANLLAREYDLTSEEYQRMLMAQGYLCAIHGGARRTRLQVDHDHNPEAPFVRGLLCGTCNTILGRVRDSVDLLKRYIDYLENPPAYAVIGRRAVRGAHVREVKSDDSSAA